MDKYSVDDEIIVIGLGYVGLTLSVFLADLGFKVTGVEIRKEVLDSLAESKSFFHEPGLNELIAKNIQNGNFRFKTEIPLTRRNRVFIITVGTPIDENKKVIDKSISRVAREVSSRMQDGDLIILRSTVKIGTTKSLIEPILQESNKIFNLAFCPERTLEGAALTELAYLPQIIGGINIESCERSARFFRKVTSSVITVANTETAEMIKLVDNMQRDVKFAISNEIAEMCNSQKINASEVISAGKLGYPRTNLSLPGPVGGPCLEKDSYILAESFEGFDVQPNIALTARATNERMIITVGNYILDWLEKNIGNKASQITILGMAFKGVPETDDLRGSTSVELFRFLKNNSKGEIKIKLWDPVISKSDIRIDGFCLETSLVNALEGSGVVILANNHPALQECHPEIIRDGLHSPHLIYDLWNRFGKSINSTNNSQYVPWGNHSFQEDSLTQ